jgi:hypothetical protein
MTTTFNFKKEDGTICHRCYAPEVMVCINISMDHPNASVFDTITLCNNCGLMYGDPPANKHNVLMGKIEAKKYLESKRLEHEK